jgi:hypothetical protein
MLCCGSVWRHRGVCSVCQCLGWPNARVFITNVGVKVICEHGFGYNTTRHGLYLRPPVASSYLPSVICKRRRKTTHMPHKYQDCRLMCFSGYKALQVIKAPGHFRFYFIPALVAVICVVQSPTSNNSLVVLWFISNFQFLYKKNAIHCNEVS